MNFRRPFLFFVVLLFACPLLFSCAGGEDDSARGRTDDDSANGGTGDGEHDDDALDDDAADDDETAPRVTGHSPENGDAGLRLATVVVVTFSEPMDQISVEISFLVDDGAKGIVGGDYSWDETGQEVTFTPHSFLLEGAEHTVTIMTGACDTTGNRLEDRYDFAFRTVNLWTRTHDGPNSDVDAGRGIALDEGDNIYVTGSESAAGEKANVWVRRLDGDGNGLWTSTYNGAADGDDEGRGVALDGNGNVFIAGWETADGAGRNVWVRKYDASGTILWTATCDGAAGLDDEGLAIAADEDGSVYAAGYVTSVAGDKDAWLRKYSADGEVQWTIAHAGPAAGDDVVHGLAVDVAGRVYAIGYETVAGEGENVWLGNYDADGNELWTETYNGTAGGDDRGYAAAADGEGNVYAIGMETAAGEGADIWLCKYGADGAVLWADGVSGPAGAFDCGYGIAVDAAGRVYATGAISWLAEIGSDVWVRKYDADGFELWSETHNGQKNFDDAGYGIDVDGDGNVFVIGYEQVLAQEANIWVRKYDPDGCWSDG